MATKLLSIKPRADGGRDVIYDDDTGRYACQIYDTKDYPQRFTWMELTFALNNNLLPLSIPALIDKRTEEEITADRVVEIKSLLTTLDREVPRISEDLVVAVKKLDAAFVLDPAKQAIIDQKAALRAELATLTTP